MWVNKSKSYHFLEKKETFRIKSTVFTVYLNEKNVHLNLLNPSSSSLLLLLLKFLPVQWNTTSTSRQHHLL